MSSLSRELVFLILQFLDEEKFKETVHKLEQESGFYFNMKYFEEEVQNGNWDEVERYLGGFTKVDDNRYSMKIFFEIRKQKYLEALDKHDRAKAVEILVKDLKVFASFNEELFKEITQLLTLENFRENEQLSKYGDTKSARLIMLVELKKLIEANPLFRDKLQFPNLKNSRLRTLINQSLNWQHQLCKNPRPNPDIKTLFVDHSCGQPNGAHAPSPANNPLLGSMPKAGGFPPLGVHVPFQPTPTPVPTPLAGWMSNPTAVTHPSVSGGAIGLGAPTNPAAILKHPRTPNTNPVMDYPSADSEHVSKRPRPIGISDEVNLPVNILPVTYPQSHSQSMYTLDDLPKTVARTLNQGSAPMSMDFHPVQQTILLVGTNVGDIGLWDVGTRERLISRNFKVWDLGKCSGTLQNTLVKDPSVSVNRVIWSSDGLLFGVAYSRHIVQIYSYHGGDDARQHLEIDAHIGGVNDIAFAIPNKHLSIITCGDDKTIKVWDATSGTRQHIFEGHQQPVYSVCPHYKENIQSSPRIRFNKEGTLLVVSSLDNGIKILANTDGIRLLRTFENRPFDPSRTVSEALSKPIVSPIAAAAAAAAVGTSSGLADRAAPSMTITEMNGDSRNLVDVKPRIANESIDKSKIWKLTEISEPTKCRSLRLMDVYCLYCDSQFICCFHVIIESNQWHVK